MKRLTYSLALAASLILTGCSEDTFSPDDNNPDGKEMISFSLSDNTGMGNMLRVGFGGHDTFLAMRMQSNEKGGSGVKYTRTIATAKLDGTNSGDSYSTVEFNDADTRYWDDAHGRKSLLSVFAVAIPNKSSNDGLESKLAKGDESNDWGTNSNNTIVWSVTKDAQTKTNSTENTFEVTGSSGTIDKEDLVYSNNIQSGGTDGVYRWDYSSGKYLPNLTGATTHSDGQMLFFQDGMTVPISDAINNNPGHFDKGHLKFNHALSRITVKLVEGEGFDKDAAGDFQFATSTNVTLVNMYVKGTLNLPTGVWTLDPSEGIANITKMADTGSGNYPDDDGNYPKAKYYTMTSQMLPDYVFNDANNTNVMQFEIDGNQYFITQDMLFDALYAVEGNRTADYGFDTENKNKFTMKQGKNYQFTIKVDKTKIEHITATLAPWVDVTAGEFPMDNSHIEFTLRDNSSGEACSQGINFYELTEDLGKIYTDNSYITDGKGITFKGDYLVADASKGGNALATLTDMTGADAGKYSTNWYFEDNKTAYHFRTVSDNAKATLANPTSPDPVNTYFTMTGAAGATLPDYHWGAPMKTGKNLHYDPTSSNGYKANIHEGLTSTHSDIMITEMHMLSNLYITLETTTGTDKVVLSGATIKLTKLANTATVDMGTGYITPTTTMSDEVTMQTPSDYWTTENVKTKAFQYAVIPQPLMRGTGVSDDDYIGITITTSDHNQYYVVRKLKTILADVVTDQRDQTLGAPIERWFPGHNYNYNIKITKNGIDAITATVAKWVDVTAKDHKITLED